ncbi:unnamed protein product [Enterobius vermicularis]|uniref:Tetraspanin n=1 Tax=Enterobius vermicularis TaxID=51028 RepID=A0A0N4VE95_ENTVE|nr:unnamed protein product [Enterobius vermicularis]
MTLSCGSKVLKYMLFFTNGIVCAASVFFLIVAIRGLASDVFPKGFPSTPERFEFSKAGLIMLAVFATLSFLISFMGCLGAVNEQRGLLLAYALIMFVFIFCLIAAQIVAASSYSKLEETAESVMTDAYKGKEKNATELESFKKLEMQFHCCGPSVELKKIWVAAGACKNETSDWEFEAPCSKLILQQLGVACLVVTLVLLFATIIAMGSACCLRSAIIDRGSYVAFS